MMNFTLKYCTNKDFLIFFGLFCLVLFCFESQKSCFPRDRFSMFTVLFSICVICPCFPHRGKLATLDWFQLRISVPSQVFELGPILQNIKKTGGVLRQKR